MANLKVLADEDLILTRVSAPGKQDTAPKGTKCRVRETGTELIYIQKNEDENDPKWEEINEKQS